MNQDFRHEFKYLLNRQEAGRLEAYVNKLGLKKDRGGPYTVLSLYFDTPLLKDYFDKQAGIKRRRKLRARIYEENFNGLNSDVWLEVKEKQDMTVFKTRRPISAEDWRRFCRGGRFHLDCLPAGEKTEKFRYHFLSENYRPKVAVRYRRKAYLGNFFKPFRLTLDSRLEACKWRDFRYNVNAVPVEPGRVVLEVKFFDAMPWWFNDMVYRFGLKRQAFSKYAKAVDAVNRFNKIAK